MEEEEETQNMQEKQTTLADMQEIKNNNHAVLGEIVKEYHLMIKPALRQRNYTGAGAVIRTSNFKLQIMVGTENGEIKDDAYQRVNGVFWNCKGALASLSEAVTYNYTGEHLEEMLYQAERKFKRMDDELKDDPAYMKQRKID